MKKQTKLLIIISAIILVPLIIWLSSLLKCEVLTHKYYDDFSEIYKQNAMLSETEMEYFKVLSYSDETADVYYVEKDMTAGIVLTFEKENGSWIETNWHTVWAVSGSASETIYPYWWHFIYGGV